MIRRCVTLIFSIFGFASMQGHEPVVTAKKLLEHKRDLGHLDDYQAPETILVCYQKSTMKYLLEKHPEFKPSNALSHFFIPEDNSVGILGDLGVGAPGLAIKVEELIALGAKRFIAVGTAGDLMKEHQIADFISCPKALAEDGVAHLYLQKKQAFAEADAELALEWDAFAKKHSLPMFSPANAWSFSALFKETVEDVLRVRKLGCSVVEMEAATLYAIGREKNVQTFSLFVISDSISNEEWTPHIRSPQVKENLHKLADWALAFCLKIP